MLRCLALGLVPALFGVQLALAAPRPALPEMADKALYCTELYLEAARVISDEGDPIAGRAIRSFSADWLDVAYRLANGLSRSQVNALRPAYAAEARRDVARKSYRYRRCGSMTSTQ